MKSDIDIKKDFFGNIVLSRGSTLFEGFYERLIKEVSIIAK
jgi:actin-related protein